MVEWFAPHFEQTYVRAARAPLLRFEIVQEGALIQGGTTFWGKNTKGANSG